MARAPLPQTAGSTLLTDSGIETDIIFGVGRDLPAFAVFPLLSDDEGRDILERYYREHVAVAAEHGLGYVFETPSYRSSADWGTTLGYSQEELDSLDREGVAFLEWIRDTGSDGLGPSPISGLLGPRGDGYVVGATLTPELARAYHSHQIAVFADAGCDLVSGCTLNYADEGLGIGLAARSPAPRRRSWTPGRGQYQRQRRPRSGGALVGARQLGSRWRRPRSRHGAEQTADRRRSQPVAARVLSIPATPSRSRGESSSSWE